jgi:hypothetical protein
MHAGRESLIVGDLAQQADELSVLRRVQARRQGRFVLDGHSADPLRQRRPPIGEVQGAVASITGVAPPLEERACFEGVEQAHHPARGHPEVRGERLLALPRLASDQMNLAYATAGYLMWVHAITLHAVLVLPALASLAISIARS